MKILVVDDVRMSQEIAKNSFEMEGHEVFTASNGSEALSAVKICGPDIVFMDLYMPSMNGDECCMKIKSDPAISHIPVVMMTSVDNEENVERCRTAGCSDVIGKPFSHDALMDTIKKNARNISGSA